MTPHRIVVVCTANICRSPAAEVLLRDAASFWGASPDVRSMGVRSRPGQPMAHGMSAALRRAGVRATDHRSNPLDATDLAAADLILTMEVAQIRDVATAWPDALPRTFTLPEFVHRAGSVGARHDTPISEWVSLVGHGRSMVDLLATGGLDVPDPYGGPTRGYRRCVADLQTLCDRLAALLWSRTAPGRA